MSGVRSRALGLAGLYVGVTLALAGCSGIGPGGTGTVSYCNGQQATLTEPAASKTPSPAVVYVHGGSWISGNYDTGGFLIDDIGPELAARGFVVMSVNYRLGPSSPWPDQIEDVKCAVRYLRANAGALHVDAHEIGAWGQSAGGQLVALLATAGPSAGWDIGSYDNESSQVQAVVDMAGPSDFLSMSASGVSGFVRKTFLSLLKGIPAAELNSVLRAASPVTHVAPGDPPFLIFHSDNDEIVLPQQSQELADALAASGVAHQLVTVLGGGHDFDQPGETPSTVQIADMIVSFFVAELHPGH
jgi:acetyl esterase/lipase